MKISLPWRLAGIALGLLSAGGLRAADETAPVDRLPRRNEFMFHLLPTAFQQEPALDVTVMTDVTSAGSAVPPATPDRPVYVELASGGARELGEPCSEKLSEPSSVARALLAALAHNGYLPASADHPASLLIVYTWGAHNAMDPEQAAMFPERAVRQRMERTLLIGGTEQFRRMKDAAEWGESILTRTVKYEYLRDQALTDLYFAIASAYNYRDVAAGRRTLMWRTKMTVSGRGVSAVETMRPMIASAAPFFGRQMPEPAIAMPHLRRWSVEIGTPVVIETDITPPPLESTRSRNDR